MPSCWGITSGQAGMVAQVKALAAALGANVQMKQIQILKPYVYLPNALFALALRRKIVPSLIAPDSDSLAAPYPDMVISCGRRGALVAMGLKLLAPATKFIHIQDPQCSARYFDLVVAMQHDKISGPNVIKTRFALHSITPEKLQQARERFTPVFAAYAAPRIAVLLGGSTNKYTLHPEAMRRLIASFREMLAVTHGSLLITPSRRTGESNIQMLRDAFVGEKRVYIYDFVSENPYLGILAVADSIVVTNDSVNMMSEAHATGKPLYILPLPGHTRSKPARFARAMLREGIARSFDGKLEQWNYDVSDEMREVAAEIKKRLGVS